MYDKNSLNDNYKELLNYYPIFYREVYEMDEIIKANAKILDELVLNIDSSINNIFILSADENIIKRFETFLYIKSTKNKSLNDRKKYILAILSGYGKISASRIIDIIYILSELESEISFEKIDDMGNKVINISIDGVLTKNQYNDINTILKNKLPAHLLVSQNQKAQSNQTKFGLGSFVIITKERRIICKW